MLDSLSYANNEYIFQKKVTTITHILNECTFTQILMKLT